MAGPLTASDYAILNQAGVDEQAQQALSVLAAVDRPAASSLLFKLANIEYRDVMCHVILCSNWRPSSIDHVDSMSYHVLSCHVSADKHFACRTFFGHRFLSSETSMFD